MSTNTENQILSSSSEVREEDGLLILQDAKRYRTSTGENCFGFTVRIPSEFLEQAFDNLFKSKGFDAERIATEREILVNTVTALKTIKENEATEKKEEKARNLPVSEYISTSRDIRSIIINAVKSTVPNCTVTSPRDKENLDVAFWVKDDINSPGYCDYLAKIWQEGGYRVEGYDSGSTEPPAYGLGSVEALRNKLSNEIYKTLGIKRDAEKKAGQPVAAEQPPVTAEPKSSEPSIWEILAQQRRNPPNAPNTPSIPGR